MNKIKIIIENEDTGDILHLTVHEDSDINEWGTNFKTILTWLTFSSGLVNDLIKNED